MNKIVLEHDGRYKSCIIVDGKSYVLLGYDGKVTKKGNTLKGRGNEGFVNQFISDCIWHVFNEELYKIREEYDKWYDRIDTQLMTAQDVCKRESINMSLESYKNKISAGQNKIATYEAALSADRSYIKGDTIVTWIEEPEPVLKQYKSKEDVWTIPKNASSYETIRLEDSFNGNIYRHHYHSRLELSVKRFLVVFGLDAWEIYFNELPLKKDDKAKFLPVLGVEKFHERFPKFGYRKKDIKKLSEKEKETFAKYVNNGYLGKEFKQLI